MTQNNFEQLVTGSTGFLQRAALNLTRNTEQAKDLVQDTLLLALRNKSQFADGSKLEAWLFTILRNSFINSYRKQQHRQHVNRQIQTKLTKAGSEVQHNDGISRMMIDTIMQKMEELPEIYKQALKLRMAGYQYTEIAAMTGEVLGTTKSRIHFAKLMLKKKIAPMID
jgi:RNA polymerase sigma-70 factor (ECF subfamily)